MSKNNDHGGCRQEDQLLQCLEVGHETGEVREALAKCQAADPERAFTAAVELHGAGRPAQTLNQEGPDRLGSDAERERLVQEVGRPPAAVPTHGGVDILGDRGSRHAPNVFQALCGG